MRNLVAKQLALEPNVCNPWDAVEAPNSWLCVEINIIADGLYGVSRSRSH